MDATILSNALSQYQQWLADSQLNLALANAELAKLKAVEAEASA